MTILETIENLKTKKLSCTELVKSNLDNIKKLNADLNVYITVRGEEALANAKLVDEKISSALDIESLYKNSPLLGITVSHKDLFSTKDIQTTAGSNIIKGYIPPYNATVVQKIKDSGSIILGKLNEDAFGHGASGENSDFGVTKNPNNTNYVPGGSSSGTAVSVATDMSLFSTGTDTGGSIRNPAAFTNTVGLKPTYGRVSRYGIIAMASSLDSIGHITKTVKDSAYVLNQTAGFDQYDATTSKKDVPNYLDGIESGVKGLKIGVPKEYKGKGVEKEVLEKTNEAIKHYEKLGAEIVEIELEHSEHALAIYYILQPAEVSSNLGRFDGIRFGHSRTEFGDEAKRRIMIGTYTLSAGFFDEYYLKAQKVRTLVINDFKKAFKKVDVILGPVSPTLPPKIGENTNDPLKMYMMDVLTVPVNMAGLPALSVPAGFGKGDLPIGIQLIGNHFEEALLYKAGYAFEQETKYYERL